MKPTINGIFLNPLFIKPLKDEKFFSKVTHEKEKEGEGSVRAWDWSYTNTQKEKKKYISETEQKNGKTQKEPSKNQKEARERRGQSFFFLSWKSPKLKPT